MNEPKKFAISTGVGQPGILTTRPPSISVAKFPRLPVSFGEMPIAAEEVTFEKIDFILTKDGFYQCQKCHRLIAGSQFEQFKGVGLVHMPCWGRVEFEEAMRKCGVGGPQ